MTEKQETSRRIVEAYIGEYASGKSENALGRSLVLAKQGRTVTLVDLDLVEPCYTLRSLQDDLQKHGVHTLAWPTSKTFGLGEAAQTMLPAARWALRREGDIILDIGYGIAGAKVLNLVEDADTDPDLKIILVLNTSRSMTSTVEDILQYVANLGRFDSILANTHLDTETTPKIVLDGLAIVEEVGKILNKPLEAVAVASQFMSKYPDFQVQNRELRVLTRWLPGGFW